MLVIFRFRAICLFSCLVVSWSMVVSFGGRVFANSRRVKIPRSEIARDSFSSDSFDRSFMVVFRGKDLLIILCWFVYGKEVE